MLLKAEEVEQVEREILQCIKEGVQCQEKAVAILRFYNFFPEHSNPDVVTSVLLMGLASFPMQDFRTYYCMLTEDMFEEDLVIMLHKMATQLEECRFEEFWAQRKKRSSLFSQLPNFDLHIRQYISSMVSFTYQRMDSAALAALLDLSVEDLVTFGQSQGWEVSPSETTFNLNSENQHKARESTPALQFDQLTRILN
mgnify:FL=1